MTGTRVGVHTNRSLSFPSRRVLFAEEYAADILARRDIGALYVLKFIRVGMEVFEDDIGRCRVHQRQLVDSFEGGIFYARMWGSEE